MKTGFMRYAAIVLGIKEERTDAFKHLTWVAMVMNKFNLEIATVRKSRRVSKRTTILRNCSSSCNVQACQSDFSLTCLDNWSITLRSRSVSKMSERSGPFLECVLDLVHESMRGCSNCRWAIRGSICRLSFMKTS